MVMGEFWTLQPAQRGGISFCTLWEEETGAGSGVSERNREEQEGGEKVQAESGLWSGHAGYQETRSQTQLGN